MEYQLEIKQIVDYPRCRIYREFIRNLMNDRSIRTSGSSYLFYYMVLCSYANFRSSYQQIDGISYLVAPGEWICKTSELSSWFRTRFQHQAIAILDELADCGYITYTRLSRGNLIKFHITNWKKSNTALEYTYPCMKDVGFFFFSIATAHELISIGRCSEMDIVLDLWLHAIYQDAQIQGSDIGPIIYLRNGTCSPITSFSELGFRWGISKSTVSRILKKLEQKEYLSLVSFPGTCGSVIYLCNYLSTMFNISDVMLDKEEIAMTFKLPVTLPSSATAVPDDNTCITAEQIIVSPEIDSVSKSDILHVVQKIAGILSTQGLPCCSCRKSIYKLYQLSDCQEPTCRYRLKICCAESDAISQFELTLTPLQPDPRYQSAPLAYKQENI